MRDACINYHRMVGLRLGPKFVVLMFDPGDIETVLKNTRYVEKADEYRFLRPWLGDGVLLSTGRLMLSCLHYKSSSNEFSFTLSLHM